MQRRVHKEPAQDAIDPRIKIVFGDKNLGYLKRVNLALDMAYLKCDLAVIINSDVLVTDGWLEGMVRCSVDAGAELVNPMCNNAAIQSIALAGQNGARDGGMAGGRCYLDASFAASIHSPSYPDAVPSIGQCLLISKKRWVEHGPFDHELYGRGYGEECELWANVVKSGSAAKIADNVFVYHESHATHGEQASVDERSGFSTFMSRHSDIYKSKSRRAGSFPITTMPYRRRSLQ